MYLTLHNILSEKSILEHCTASYEELIIANPCVVLCAWWYVNLSLVGRYRVYRYGHDHKGCFVVAAEMKFLRAKKIYRLCHSIQMDGCYSPRIYMTRLGKLRACEKDCV